MFGIVVLDCKQDYCLQNSSVVNTIELCNNCLIVLSLYFVLAPCSGCKLSCSVVETETVSFTPPKPHRHNKSKESFIMNIYLKKEPKTTTTLRKEAEDNREQQLLTSKNHVINVAVDVLLLYYHLIFMLFLILL